MGESAATRRHAGQPVLGKLMIPRHGMNEDAVCRLGIEDLERKVGYQAASRCDGSWLAMVGVRRCSLCGLFNLCTEASPQPLADGLVVCSLGQKF